MHLIREVYTLIDALDENIICWPHVSARRQSIDTK